jgi:hypothetical protein
MFALPHRANVGLLTLFPSVPLTKCRSSYGINPNSGRPYVNTAGIARTLGHSSAQASFNSGTLQSDPVEKKYNGQRVARPD